jgi:hypothetical protein
VGCVCGIAGLGVGGGGGVASSRLRERFGETT